MRQKIHQFAVLLALAASLCWAVEVAAQSFWTPVNGPVDATVQTLFTIGTDTLVAGTPDGAYLSIDRGKNWSPLGLDYRRVWSLVLTKNGDLLAGTEAGIWRLKNFKTSIAEWEPLVLPLRTVLCLAIASQGQLYAATDDGLYRSGDNGNTWQPAGLSGRKVYSVAADAQGRLFAGAGVQIQRSTNNGDTWSVVANMEYPCRAIAINSKGTIFVGNDYYGVQRSTDTGLNWEQVNTGLGYYNIFALALDSQGTLYAGTYNGIYRTTNEAEKWSLLGLNDTKILAIAAGPAGFLYAGANHNGVFLTANGGSSWTQRLQFSPVHTICIIQTDQGVFNGTEFIPSPDGLLRSTDNGDNWTLLSLKYGGIHSLAYKPEGLVFAGGQDTIYRSANNGDTWTPLALKCGKIWSLTTNAQGILYAGTGKGVQTSSDNGQQWSPARLQDKDIYLVATNNQGTLYAALASDTLYRSTNNGSTWTPLVLKCGKIWSLAINAQGSLFLGADAGLFRSSNNGDTWTPLAIKYGKIWSVAINPLGHLYAASYGNGVWRSLDNGDTWEAVNSGLTYPWVSALAFNRAGYLFAGTVGAGVFRSARVTRVYAPEESGLNMKLFPNPASNLTRLDIALPEAAELQWQVVTPNGQVMRTGQAGMLPAGQQSVEISLQGLPAGWYLVKVRVDGWITALPLTLLPDQG